MIFKGFQWDEDNPADVEMHDRLQDVCNQARNFFDDETEEYRIVRAFREYQMFNKEHVDKLLATLCAVERRIMERLPHGAFPAELKQQYLVNISRLIDDVRKIHYQLQ
jgi:hypothetical protein